MPRPLPSDAQIAKILSHPLRTRILEVVADLGEASPNRIASETGSPLGSVSYHVRILRESGWLELVRTLPRRGAVEHFYRATRLPFLDDAHWDRLPGLVRQRLASQTIGLILEAASHAAVAGGFDAAHAHISRMPLALDDAGWEELAALLAETLEEAEQIQQRSDRRASGDVQRSEMAILHYRVAAA